MIAVELRERYVRQAVTAVPMDLVGRLGPVRALSLRSLSGHGTSPKAKIASRPRPSVAPVTMAGALHVSTKT